MAAVGVAAGAARRFHVALVVAAGLSVWVVAQAAPRQDVRSRQGAEAASVPKRVLAWADTRFGADHDSVTRALVTIERLGRESGLYETSIRTDSQLITKAVVSSPTTGQRVSRKNLDYFDAIFFFGVREIDLSRQQRDDLLSFVRDDGKGFVAAHTASTAFFSWPEFHELLGGRYDGHPWGIVEATVIIEDPAFPAMRGLPHRWPVRDEHYQTKDFSRTDIHVLARLDPATVDLDHPDVRRDDRDFPVAWSKTYGQGRVFYCTLGHAPETWDDPLVQTLYLGAIKWALGLESG